MPKSVFSKDYKRLLQQIRSARRQAGLTQEEVARSLRQTQSWVSKCERGERRIDILELRAFCRTFQVSFVEFVRRLDRSLGA